MYLASREMSPVKNFSICLMNQENWNKNCQLARNSLDKKGMLETGKSIFSEII